MIRYRKTGIRCNLKLINGSIKDIKQWMQAHRILINYASKKFLTLLQTDAKFRTDFFSKKGKKINHFVEWSLRSPKGSKEKTEYELLAKSLGLDLARSLRIGVLMGSRFLTGDGQRNGENGDNGYEYNILKFPAITRQNKAIHLTDGFIKIDVKQEYKLTEIENSRLVIVEDMNFKLQTLNGFTHQMSVAIPKAQSHLLKYIKQNSPGGNIRLTKKGNLTFQLLIDEPYETAYDYTEGKVLGLDFNQRANVFVTCSDGTIYRRDESTQKEINEVTELLKKINDGTRDETTNRKVINSRKRRPLRRKWQTKYNKICHTLRHIADEIMHKVETQKLLLCIDGVATGNSNSFGHTELKDMLIEHCKSKNIPYIIVPSYHTSSDCAVCYEHDRHTLVARSSDAALVSCAYCEKNYHADINAAKLIAKDGVFLYLKTDVDKFNKKCYVGRPNSDQRKKMKQPIFINYDVF